MSSSSEKGTYRICEQQRLRQACAYAQSHQSLRCSLIQYREVEEASDKVLEILLHWIAAHARLKEQKTHNTMGPVMNS